MMEKMHNIMLITGTRKGIGKSLAEFYLNKGFIVAGCSRGKASISHDNYKHYELDITKKEDVVMMVRDVIKKFKKIDFLINNAGIASMNHMILTPDKSVKDIFGVNFEGTFFFMREVSKTMFKQQYGRIVNFTTVAVPLRLEGEIIYASSKAAVETLTQIAAKELGVAGITVNAIGPSPVLTDLIKNVPQNKIDDLIKQQAIKRFGTIADITNVIDFFIKEESGFITGQVIYLGGING